MAPGRCFPFLSCLHSSHTILHTHRARVPTVVGGARVRARRRGDAHAPLETANFVMIRNRALEIDQGLGGMRSTAPEQPLSHPYSRPPSRLARCFSSPGEWQEAARRRQQRMVSYCPVCACRTRSPKMVVAKTSAPSLQPVAISLFPIPAIGTIERGTQWLNCLIYGPWSRTLNASAIACRVPRNRLPELRKDW